MEHSSDDSILEFRPPREQRELVALARYLSDEAEEDEALQVRDWIVADPARQRMVGDARRAWDIAAEPTMEWDTDRVWERIKAQRTPEQTRWQPQIGFPSRWIHGYTAAAIATVALVLSGATVILQHIARDAGMSSVASSQTFRTFATRRGQRSTIHLADGTKMVIGADSRVRVPEGYGRSNRDLYLDGAAYFSVRHDATLPLVVYTRFGVTRDLATRFAVTAYSTDLVQRVVVAAGRVASSALHSAPVVLTPGDMAVLDRAGRMSVRHGIDAEESLVWTQGDLRFDDVSLKHVAAELERWYDVRIDLETPGLDTIRLTASLGDGTVDDALHVIGRLVGVRYVKQGSYIRILKEPGR